MLRVLCGGAYVDTADVHGVSESTVYTAFWESILVVNQVLTLSFDISNNEDMAALEQGFAEKTGHVLRGFIGAIDGIAIKIRKPMKGETIKSNAVL
jgi:hypothetical protein